ncbi:MAG: CAP domain-containing protein, partial [Ignavibacteriota bacterium]
MSLGSSCLLFLATPGFSQVHPAPIASPQPVHIELKALPNSAPLIQSQPQATVYDHGDPTAEEQVLLEMINRARANPTAEGIRLANSTDPDVVFSYTYWPSHGDQHYATPANVKAAFATYPVRPPLAFNKKLIQAARGHSQDMITHNYQGHVDFDGTDLTGRYTKAGYNGWFNIGENVAAYSNSIEFTHDALAIDFGDQNQQVLGHRTNMMNFTGAIFTEVGIGALHGGAGLPNEVGTIVTTQDFGLVPGPHFITGVVYGDDNHNDFYDVGEGMAGVKITVTSGSFEAVSSTSGGYAIPFTSSGAVTVTASGGILSAPISHTVTLADENIKVDFIQGKTGLPEQPLLIAPVADTLIHTDTARFSWVKTAGETKYWIEVSTDRKFSKLNLKDTNITTPARLLPKVGGKETVLLDGTTYYWQVKSKNLLGWGKFSAIDSFVVGLAPKAVSLIAPANAASVSPDADITFTWKSINPQIFDYWIEISKSNTMANPIHSDTLYPEPDTTVTYP